MAQVKVEETRRELQRLEEQLQQKLNTLQMGD